MKLRKMVVLTILLNEPLFAVEQDTVTYAAQVPLAISVDTIGTTSQVTPGEIISMQWMVHSNNAFRYKFSGVAKDEAGKEVPYPMLYKQEIDANGKHIPNSYEVMDTLFGVTVSDYGSVQQCDNWGKGMAAVGSAADLVKEPADLLSPSGSMGRIMASDADNQAKIGLYAKGIADMSDQSGLYNAVVMLTVIPDEQ
jgi:hypothetical protein